MMLQLLPKNRISLHAAGTFGGEPVTLRLESDGTRMTGGNELRAFDQKSPKSLREAVAIGLARMGILHNLSRLVEGVPPDHAEGGAKEWSAAENVRSSDSAEPADADLVHDLFVSGERSAEVRLRMDDGLQLPGGRTLHVEFPGGSMEVTGTYLYSIGEEPSIPGAR